MKYQHIHLQGISRPASHQTKNTSDILHITILLGTTILTQRTTNIRVCQSDRENDDNEWAERGCKEVGVKTNYKSVVNTRSGY